MDREELIRHYPRLFHMAEAGSWPSICEHGLLSTSALLDLYEVNGPRRTSIESAHRPVSVPIAHRIHGTAVIRDQKPMSEQALARCLEGMNPRDWYETLNRRVFFWVAEERLARLLSARLYRSRRHDVIVVDTRKLVERHAASITLSAINSGSTIFNPQPRGAQTFLRIEHYPFQDWRRRRGIRNAVVELAVDYGVRSITDVAICVESRSGSAILETLWSADS